ncbi:hypothetical protein BRADI_1g36755v3 [Brachypodium distachyon]|uniref:Uncharacterized protein n=1 Tax=Brachypodium distachyon TaxID=15368 RepID=A0A0Q3H5Q4_BRADI|nr:hypothetical protein BRADI_1g36755v3 [Brachypodium distachyon]
MTAAAPRLPTAGDPIRVRALRRLRARGLAQLFDATAAAPDEHLAVPPSLNQLLSATARTRTSSTGRERGERLCARKIDARLPQWLDCAGKEDETAALLEALITIGGEKTELPFSNQRFDAFGTRR